MVSAGVWSANDGNACSEPCLYQVCVAVNSEEPMGISLRLRRLRMTLVIAMIVGRDRAGGTVPVYDTIHASRWW